MSAEGARPMRMVDAADMSAVLYDPTPAEPWFTLWIALGEGDVVADANLTRPELVALAGLLADAARAVR